ncbi:haloacid dehalogenase-like hydrolase domain-containing protein 2 [Clavelina lepadiformis]|uniref:Haloacid dehalogenase-like hydrolase domain-containing protein 2 n=1 Tax=Clavelina lepadiformis TaxID=159417 RepID=A0ABP0GK38_CLALP
MNRMTQIFQRAKAVLVDLSGTLHIEDQVIPGCHEALSKLRKSGLKVKFVTNTTKEDLHSLHQRLIRLGFEIEENEIYTSLTAARQLLESEGSRPYLMLTESAKKDFVGIDTNVPNAVVVGLSSQHFRYEAMNYALRLLLDGASLIAINKARYFKRPDGFALGPGAFAAALEYATDKKSTIVGKPEASFFLGAIKDLDCTPEECVMIGDDVRDDIDGAIKAKMEGILVQTGKYIAGDEDKISLSKDCVAQDFSNAVDMILSSR